MSPRFSIAVPTWRDTRVWVVLVFGLLIYRALSFAGFGRVWSQVVVSVASGGVLDLFFNRLKYKRWIFPLSGLMCCVGPFIFIDSVVTSYYALMAFLTIGSKYFFRWNDRHIFSPNTFGMLVASIGLSAELAPNPSRWGGAFEWTLIIFVAGAAIVWMADRWAAALAYYWTFFLGCLFRSWLGGVSIWVPAGTMLGPAFPLICFVLITDPKTSPNSRKLQVLYGVCVALLDTVFRFYESRLSIFFAIILTNLLYAVVDHFTGDSRRSDPWREMELEVGARA